MIHPAIRIITLMVFAMLICRADIMHLSLAGLVLLVLYTRMESAAIRMAMAMIMRMRWFFLSLLLIYGWLSPDPVSGQPVYWGWPSAEGLAAGCRQIAALVLIMLAVNLLLRSSRREELLQAIYWLAWPLSWLGVSRSRLALRLVLVLDRVAIVREQADQVLVEQQAGVRGRLATIVSAATRIITRTLEQADHMADEQVIFQPLASPPWYQWGLPLLLIPVLFLLPV
jgi:energy-coupling factor transporter transmembrane protein EcfT